MHTRYNSKRPRLNFTLFVHCMRQRTLNSKRLRGLVQNFIAMYVWRIEREGATLCILFGLPRPRRDATPRNVYERGKYRPCGVLPPTTSPASSQPFTNCVVVDGRGNIEWVVNKTWVDDGDTRDHVVGYICGSGSHERKSISKLCIYIYGRHIWCVRVDWRFGSRRAEREIYLWDTL